MPPAPLTPTLRYIPPSVRKYYFVTTIATQASPTRAELNAGVDLTAEVAGGGVSGFDLASSTVETPDLATRYSATIPGRITSSASSISFYASSTSSDVRSVLPRDTVGFIVVLNEGDVTGQKMDVFKVKVLSSFVDPNTDNPAQVNVGFAITAQPSQNVTIP